MDKKPEQVRKKLGRPPRYGGYSLAVRAGDLPKNRIYVRRYLESVRAGLVRDLGPIETDLSTAEIVLVDRIISKLGIVRCIEEHIRETGIMAGDDLAGPLRASYLAYSNSVRLDLMALGIKTRAADSILDLGRYIEQKERTARAKDAGKAEKRAANSRSNRQGKDAEAHGHGPEAAEIACPASTSRDFSSKGDPIEPDQGNESERP
jgi:hypothetical protein